MGVSVFFIIFGEVVIWKFFYNFIVVIGFFFYESCVDGMVGKWCYVLCKEVEVGWWCCEFMVGIIIGVRCVDYFNIIWYCVVRL